MQNGRQGRDRMVVLSPITLRVRISLLEWRGALDTTLCDKVCK